MEVYPVLPSGARITDNILSVWVRCYICSLDIKFTAPFQAYSEIPYFTPVIASPLKKKDYLKKGRLIRCPQCGKYFVDDHGKGYAIEPQEYAMWEWWNIVRKCAERKTTSREAQWCHRQEQLKIVHLPANMRTSEKFGKKRQKPIPLNPLQKKEFGDVNIDLLPPICYDRGVAAHPPAG